MAYRIVLAECDQYHWKTVETSRRLYVVMESKLFPPGTMVATEPGVFPPSLPATNQPCTFTSFEGAYQAVCTWVVPKDRPLLVVPVFVLKGLSW